MLLLLIKTKLENIAPCEKTLWFLKSKMTHLPAHSHFWMWRDQAPVGAGLALEEQSGI